MSPIIALNETDSSGKRGAGTPQQGAYVVGIFKFSNESDSGRKAVLIQNQRFDTELWPTVTFGEDHVAANASRIREVDISSGKLRMPRDDSPGLPGLQLALPPGSARLLVFLV